MKRKSRQKRTLRQRCFELSLLGAVGAAAITAIAYRRQIVLLARLSRLHSAVRKNNSVLERPAQELLQETRLITDVAKAGWPVHSSCVGGSEDDRPFMIVTVPSGERAKLCASPTGDGFVLDTLIDSQGGHHPRTSLSPGLQATNLPYKKFISLTKAGVRNTQTTTSNSTPA